MYERDDDFAEAVCAYHGRTLFKLGFCVQCIATVHNEETEDALHRLAMRQLHIQREAANEVCSIEETDTIIPTPPIPLPVS